MEPIRNWKGQNAASSISGFFYSTWTVAFSHHLVHMPLFIGYLKQFSSGLV